MSDTLQYFATWISVLLILSAIGRFIDYLLNTKLRRKEKTSVEKFFGKLFFVVNKADFSGIQQIMIEGMVRLKQKTLGERILTPRYFIVSLLISQYLTSAAFYVSQFSQWEPFDTLNYAALIPLLPFTGFAFVHLPSIEVVSLLEHIGLYWNNYVFDCLTIASTLVLLEFVQRRKKYFLVAASVDILLSYIFAYLCLLVYFASPPASNLMPTGFTTFIPDIWSGRVGVNRIFIFYSLTTFVPIALYMTLLGFLTVCKGIQWVAATIFADFAEESSKTVFWKVASALTVTAFLLTQMLNLLLKVAKK